MRICLRRRDFIVGLGSAAAEPVLARAQQVVRRVGVLANDAEDTAIIPKYLPPALQKLGWIEGRNLTLDVRYAASDVSLYRSYAAELVGLKPDVIVTGGVAATTAVQQQTQTIPIVFGSVGDPIAAGIVKSLAHPEGNATGITAGFASLGGKMVQLLKEAVPRIERVADLPHCSLRMVFRPRSRRRRIHWACRCSGFPIATPLSLNAQSRGLRRSQTAA